MRRILICSGVLGGGTAIVFAAAAVTAVLIPPSRIVPQAQNVMFERGGPAMLAPVPAVIVGGTVRANDDVVVDLPAPTGAP